MVETTHNCRTYVTLLSRKEQCRCQNRRYFLHFRMKLQIRIHMTGMGIATRDYF